MDFWAKKMCDDIQLLRIMATFAPQGPLMFISVQSNSSHFCHWNESIPSQFNNPKRNAIDECNKTFWSAFSRPILTAPQCWFHISRRSEELNSFNRHLRDWQWLSHTDSVKWQRWGKENKSMKGEKKPPRVYTSPIRAAAMSCWHLKGELYVSMAKFTAAQK